MLLPENAPAEYKNRATLWNAVEKVEKASNSQLAREIEIALPRELNFSQYFGLVLKYVEENFTSKGMIADVAIHVDEEKRNPHCHILLTMRPFRDDGTWDDKQRKVYHLDKNGEKIYDPKKRQYKCSKVQTTDWNERHKAEEWRESWANMCNAFLEQHNRPERIDHRSYKRQGKSQIPTVHLGVAAHQMEKRGIRTELGDINRAIEISNRRLRELDSQINDLMGLLAEERALYEAEIATPLTPKTEEPKPQPAEPTPPTFAKTILDICTRQAQGRPVSEDDVKLFNFLVHNKINDYEGLEGHLTDLMEEQRKLGHEYNPIRSRLAELSEHIRQNEDYKKWRAEYQQYQKDLAAQMPWRKKSFAADNDYIVHHYNEAKENIDSLKNEQGKIPLASWQREHTELSAKLRELDGRYQVVKEKVTRVNKFRVRVYDFLRKEQREHQRTQPTKKRSQDVDR